MVGGFIRAGVIPFVVFPKLDTRTIEARITFPDGTPGEVTDRATEKMEQALLEVAEQEGGNLVRHRYRMAGWTTYPNNASAIGGSFNGGHLGLVSVELVPPEDREVHSERLMNSGDRRWNDTIRGRVSRHREHFVCRRGLGPGGTPIEFKLLSPADDESFARLGGGRGTLQGQAGGI